MKKCELLAPAGSYDAFVAAISAGADAVYLGGTALNARIGAKNFTKEEISRAVREAHLYGRRVYITLNTLVSDKELAGALDEAGDLLSMGADALIVQDLGLLSALHEVYPTSELHASTQCVTHSLDQIRVLHSLGVSRAVVARELDEENLRLICRESPVDIEVFVHGALCVCHSGGCLFSSLVGGRSGNRGECAQPCRLPYSQKGQSDQYPLSLKDLTLSTHLTKLRDMGVSSLKIEGRMKSPDYVAGVVSVFRRLLDQERDADRDDLDQLARIFSRDGFTDKYFTGKPDGSMLGVRRAEDKEKTRAVAPSEISLPKIKIDASLSLASSGGELTFKKDGVKVSTALAPPLPAENRPLGRESALEQIGKMGDTPFIIDTFNFSCDGDYFIKRSELNSARRDAAEKLFDALSPKTKEIERGTLSKVSPSSDRTEGVFAVFAPHRRASKKEIDALLSLGIDRIYLPIFRFPDAELDTRRIGLLLPFVVFDSQKKELADKLRALREKGHIYALTENLGVAALAKSEGFKVFLGGRINAYNSRTLKVLSSLGFEGAMLSHEAGDPMKRAMIKALPAGELIYEEYLLCSVRPV